MQILLAKQSKLSKQICEFE